jgi:formate-dependent nitrite reductase membrane component NrfD
MAEPDKHLQRPLGQYPRQQRAPVLSPQAPQREPSYYDISMLKAPVWKWEIASYFFLGGLSAGAFTIARLAEHFGGGDYRSITRAGTFVAAAALVPCAPLLIHDLGDRKRFHHMLRVFKPHSPMSLGSWTLTAYSGVVAVALLRQWAMGRSGNEHASLANLAEALQKSDGAIVAISDAAGVPLAILMAGYTGVLLSCTATPLWSGNPWLGPLFSASAIGSGAEAISAALDLSQGSGTAQKLIGAGRSRTRQNEKAQRVLCKISTASHAAEDLALAGFLRRAGPLARPLTRGKMKPHLWASIAGLLGGEVLKHLPLPSPRLRRFARMLGCCVGLASGFSLRWALVYGGHESASDPSAARRITSGSRSKSISDKSAPRQMRAQHDPELPKKSGE